MKGILRDEDFKRSAWVFGVQKERAIAGTIAMAVLGIIVFLVGFF